MMVNHLTNDPAGLGMLATGVERRVRTRSEKHE
jgi:hypothetical protein